MVNFFIEGGIGMFPVLALGLVVFYTSLRYMLDLEPVRLRLVTVSALAVLALIAQATVLNVAMVLKALQDSKEWPNDFLVRMLFTGLKESSRPAILGMTLLSLAMIFVTIGVYRVARRELRAVRG